MISLTRLIVPVLLLIAGFMYYQQRMLQSEVSTLKSIVNSMYSAFGSTFSANQPQAHQRPQQQQQQQQECDDYDDRGRERAACGQGQLAGTTVRAANEESEIDDNPDELFGDCGVERRYNSAAK